MSRTVFWPEKMTTASPAGIDTVCPRQLIRAPVAPLLMIDVVLAVADTHGSPVMLRTAALALDKEMMLPMPPVFHSEPPPNVLLIVPENELVPLPANQNTTVPTVPDVSAPDQFRTPVPD